MVSRESRTRRRVTHTTSRSRLCRSSVPSPASRITTALTQETKSEQMSDSWNQRAQEVRVYRGKILNFRCVEDTTTNPATKRWGWFAGKENEEISPTSHFVARGWLKAWVRLMRGESPDYIVNESGKPFPKSKRD